MTLPSPLETRAALTLCSALFVPMGPAMAGEYYREAQTQRNRGTGYDHNKNFVQFKSGQQEGVIYHDKRFRHH